jgi:enediyne polyketide synthase
LQTCLIGDPGARDAALHSVQACIPNKIVIPIAVEEVDCAILRTGQPPYRCVATEIEDRGDELIYDLTISDCDGRPVERWRRIAYRVLGEVRNLHLSSLPLAAPFLERRIAARIPQAKLRISIEPMPSGPRNGMPAFGIDYRPDGKPDSSFDSLHYSAAYDGEWKLTVSSLIPVGCDMQAVLPRSVEDWELILGPEGSASANITAGVAQESIDFSATRVWTVREAMKKVGWAWDALLTIDAASVEQWVIFKSGNLEIFSSTIVSVADSSAICVAVALLRDRGDA